MLFVTKYKFKGDRSPATVKAMLAAFAESGGAPGEVAHYVTADGRGGIAITENEGSAALFEHTLPFLEWMDVEIIPVLTIDDAMPSIMSIYS